MKPELFQVHAEVELDHWWFVARRRIMRRVLAVAVPPDPARLVIDVGCGTGANVAALADDYRVLGIDDSEQGIELARRRFPAVEFRRGRAPQDLGDRMGEASAVLLMDVLEHVPDDAAVLGPIVRALPAGAAILVTVPADMRLWSEHDVSFGHYRRYDEPMLRAAWRDLPVEPLLVSHFNRRLLPVVRAVRAAGRLRGGSFGRAGSDLSMPPRPVNRLLERIFAGEADRLGAIAAGRPRAAWDRGVSMIALLRRSAEA